MIFGREAILLLLKVLGVLALVCIARAIQVHMKLQKQIARLQAQGITSYPGNDTFLTGPVKAMEVKYFNQAAANGRQSPMPTALIWMLEMLTSNARKPGEPAIDASKNRMVTLNLLGKVVTYVQDPDVINDMYHKHSPSIDKSEIVGEQYEPMFK